MLNQPDIFSPKDSSWLNVLTTHIKIKISKNQKYGTDNYLNEQAFEKL